MSELTGDPRNYGSERYALSGRIMLSAIVILFTVVLLIICLHIYARWFLARSRRQQQQHLRNRRRRAHIVFTSDGPSTTITHGLDASLLKSLPTFVYSCTTQEELMECAVCLSEFEENEKGRLLPKCNHSFHTACIDMWFHSHSTCPLCRSPVVSPETPEPKEENTQIEIVIDSANSQPNSEEMGPSSSSSSSSSSNSTQNLSVGSRRKAFEIVGVSIEVTRRNDSFKSLEEEIQAGQLFKSPGGRILSFKRIMSRDRRPSTPMSCSSSVEINLERGEIEEQGAGGAPPPPNHRHQDH